MQNTAGAVPAMFEDELPRSYDAEQLENFKEERVASNAVQTTIDAQDVLRATNTEAIKTLKATNAEAIKTLKATNAEALKKVEAENAEALKKLEAENAEALKKLEAENAESEEAADAEVDRVKQISKQTTEDYLRCEFESWARERMLITRSLKCCGVTSLRMMLH